ncbi:MAG: Bax inhibitor-1/YccA family protein [Robiginitomaculum sp.]|nr:Bax inhibitor-1/YccA family protein [Robiginitomaculum sp.]
MNQFSNNSVAQGGEMDLGLRSFMLGTYKYMVAAMAVSALTAYLFGTYVLLTPSGNLSSIGHMLNSPAAAIGLVIGIMVMFGAVGRKMYSMSVGAVKVFLFSFAGVMGVWLSSIAVMVDPMISVRIFFMATVAFLGVSLVGYTIKKDLGGIAKFFIMVFVGFVAINILGMFIPALAMSGTAGFIFNLVGLVAICGITAWETQSLKRIYYNTAGNPEMAEKMAVYGAASLLLAFINIFSILMSMFGGD